MLLGQDRLPLPPARVCVCICTAFVRTLKRLRTISARRFAGILVAALSLACPFIGIGGGIQNSPARLPASLNPPTKDYPAQLDSSLQALGRGVEDYLNSGYAAALEALPGEEAAKNMALGDYVLLYRAKANLMLERGDEALRLFRLVHTRYADSPLYSDALLGECLAHLKLHDAEAALAALQNPALDGRADAFFYRGRALEDLGRQQEANELYLRVYCNFVNSASADQARERLLALSPRALSSTQNYKSLLVRADNLLRAGRNREARALLLQLQKVRAPEKLSGEKRSLLQADAEYHLGKTAAVLPLLRKVTAADPALHARALYLEGACYRRLKREESFLRARDRALEIYPKSPYTEQLLSAVASQFDVSNDMERAQEAYRSLYERFPKGQHAERALWRMSLFAYVRKQPVEAVQGFYRYLREYPNPASAIPAIYWMARCYQSMGDISHASLLLERVLQLAHHSYYSRRATEAEQSLKKSSNGQDRLFSGLNFADVTAAVDAIQLPLPAVTEPFGEAARILERGRQLMAADLPDLALSELRSGIRRFPSERALSYIMSRVYESRDEYFEAIAALRHAFPDYNDRPIETLPKEIWQVLFPVKHWQVISTQAAKYGIDPNLVLGIIRQESSFEEEARSPANARGLMQVLPSTGRMIARQAGVRRYSVGKLYVAETNITLGLRHFSSLLQQFGNREELALAAYNAGDDRAELWSNEFGLADMAEFVERVPFSETRGYIKQVMTNQAHYALLTPSLAATER